MRRRDDPEAFERYKQEHGRCLGIVVRQMRTDRGISPLELATRAGVSERWLLKLETHQLHTNYSMGRLDRIVQALGVELYDLYKRTDEMQGPPPWLDEEGENSDE